MAGNLSTAILAAVSGQRLAQAKVAESAHNLMNVDTPGFSRKEQTYSTQVLGGIGCGVTQNEMRRITDEVKVEQLRIMESETSRLDTLSSFYSDLTRLLGEPGKNNSMCASMNSLKKSISSLVQKPESDGAQAAVLRAANNMAIDLQGLSNLAQEFRRTADSEIYSYVQDVNTLLTSLNDFNKELQVASGRGQSAVEILDLRDQSLNKLSGLMDIRVQYADDGEVSIFTNSGVPLLQGQLHQLTYTPTSALDATISYGAGQLNGILLDGDVTKDITTSITGGTIGGLIQIRDTEMPAFQATLDEMTGVLRDEINAIHNRGTSFNAPQILTGTRTGLTLADNITGAGTVKLAVVDRASGNLVEDIIIDLTNPTTLGNIINQINGMVNAHASLDANGALNVQTTNGAYGIAIASNSVPEATINGGSGPLGFSHYFGLNDFFVTGSTLTGVTPGISGQLAVKSNIQNNVNLIANTTLNIAGVVGDCVLTAGGNSTLMAMVQVFTSSASFAAVGKMPGMTTSLEDYTASIIHYTAAEDRHVEEMLTNNTTLANRKLEALESIRGVNTQEVMADLMKWLRQQKVCTELRLTAERMLDDQMRMK
jgi:flagellar hook-associated protein 1